jgi:hypothetical protein
MRRSHPAHLPLLVALVAACGGGSEPAGPPTALVAVNPGPFEGTVGEDLTGPLQVEVTDADGRGVPGIVVRFAVTAGSGSVGVGSLGGSSFTDTTDQDGAAEILWTLGTAAGEQGASASVTGLTTLEYSANAAAGPPAASLVSATSAFIAPVSSPTDEPLAVRVEDEYGNAVAGALVNWAALSAGASVAAASSTADEDGIARIGASLGAAPGLYLFRATPQGAPPDTIGVLAVVIVADPAGDQAPVVDVAYASHDVTAFGALVIQDVLVLYARFAGTISPVPDGAPALTSMWANYDLDLDADSLTGFLTLRQCAGGSPLGFGVDAFVELDPTSGFLDGQTGIPPGAVPVLRVDALLDPDRCTSSFNGSLFPALPAYQPTTVSIAIPLSFLQDDGTFGITNLFAHPATGVTDIVPDSLAWDFVPTAAAAPAPGAEALDPWAFLPVPRPSGRPVRVEGIQMNRARR